MSGLLKSRYKKTRPAASCGRHASRLPETHGGARPTAGRRTEGCERLFAVQLVKLHELVGELVAEDHLVLRNAPGRAGRAARPRLDRERLAPGVKVGEPLGHALHDLGRAERLLENVERSFRLAVDDLILRAFLVGRARIGLERLVPGP